MTLALDLVPDEDSILAACSRRAETDAAPFREQALAASEIATLAAQYASLRYMPNALFNGIEQAALRDCYTLVFRVTATPLGQWRSLDGDER